jgi:RND family efflux transporter MFP subunit
MMLRPFSMFIAMLLMLAIGVGLGVLITTSHRSPTHAVVDPPQAASPLAPSPVVRPVPDPIAQSAAVQSVSDQYVGVIFARQLADIVARSDGRLEAVYVHLGDHLKPGDVIAKIESSAITQQLDIAEASLRSTQAEARSADVELKDAEVRYSRRERLVKAGFLSKEELATANVQVERARTTLEVAQARVTEQMARARQTKDALTNTVIKAPFEGTVAVRHLDPGATVQAGRPVINLMRADDVWVRFAAPEQQRATLPVGARVGVRLEGLPAVVPGMVEHLAPGVETMSREVIIEAKLHVPAVWRGQIKPGLSGSVWVTSGPPPPTDNMPTRLLKSASRAR